MKGKKYWNVYIYSGSAQEATVFSSSGEIN
jgi:hypothetical protein